MKILLIEKDFKIKKEFQKLLDNSFNYQNKNWNETIVFKTEDILLFKEIEYNKSKEQYFLTYYSYLFFDTKKSVFQMNKNNKYYDLLYETEKKFMFNFKEPYISNMRTDYDKYDNLSLLYISVNISDQFSSEYFLKSQKEIQSEMETKILNYSFKVKDKFNKIAEAAYIN